jgi:hypothetical protein
LQARSLRIASSPVAGREILFSNPAGKPFLKVTPSLLSDDDCPPMEDFLLLLQKLHQPARNCNISKSFNCSTVPLSFFHEWAVHVHNQSHINAHLPNKRMPLTLAGLADMPKKIYK